jgi:hypothetical protein
MTLTVWALEAWPDKRDGLVTPFGSRLQLFAGPRHPYDAAPASLLASRFHGRFPSFVKAVAEMKGNPGTPLLDRSRLVLTPSESLYFVPTSRGWVCFTISNGWRHCMPGFEAQGIAWTLHNDTESSLSVFGLAEPRVSSVALVYGSQRAVAHLSRGVFSVSRPFTYSDPLPKQFGRLVIHYRGGGPTGVVTLK